MTRRAVVRMALRAAVVALGVGIAVAIYHDGDRAGYVRGYVDGLMDTKGVMGIGPYPGTRA